MYAKCGSIEVAWRVFNKMPSWNIVTLGPHDLWTLHEIWRRAESIRAILRNARGCYGVFHGCKSGIFVGNSLVHMYVKCGRIEDAWPEC
jgi:pentatricopeptide repeat protein